MEGILIVGWVSLFCTGIFFNEFILPGLIRHHNAQEKRRGKRIEGTKDMSRLD
jgi:hypothetical protein